jgi:hypothetical protein
MNDQCYSFKVAARLKMLNDNDVVATVAVRNLKRSRTFYENTLGLPVLMENKEVLTFKSGRSMLFVYRSQDAGLERRARAGSRSFRANNRIAAIVRKVTIRSPQRRPWQRNSRMKTNPALATLDRIIGIWTVTGSHPHLPGRRLHGRVTFEPVEDGAFIRMHSKMDDPEIPEGVAIFGTDDADNAGTMLYFDARGVARKYSVAFDADGFSWSRDAPQFAQCYHVTIAKNARSMEGEGEMKKDGQAWEPDLRLSYVRAAE